MRRLIYADEAIKRINEYEIHAPDYMSGWAAKLVNAVKDDIKEVISEIQTVDAVPAWIPFKMRKPDPDELEDHPDWTYVLDGQLPDEGQRILVCCVFRGHEAVQLDEFYTDADGCYLDSGYEIGTEVSAWMPLPEPYKMDEVKHDNN